MKIKILYEDSNIVVIDKPSGISVHPDGRTKEKTISDWFVENYPSAKKVGEPIVVEKNSLPRPGVVHRLDKETSGVLILVKKQKAYEFIKDQFKNKEIKKVYETIVLGYVRNDRGFVDKPIGKSPTDFRKRLAGRGAKGELKESMTNYRVIKRFLISGNKMTYLEVRPKTGRTHQIRVHMKFLNHPVVCDSLYNPKGYCPKKIERLALHARSIEFKNLKGEIIKVESKIPKEFIELVS